MEITKKEKDWVLMAILSLLVAVSVGITVFYNVKLSSNRLFSQVVRLIITSLLCFFTYKGSPITRWVLIITTISAGFLSLTMIPEMDFHQKLITTLFSIFYLSVGGYLFYYRRKKPHGDSINL